MEKKMDCTYLWDVIMLHVQVLHTNDLSGDLKHLPDFRFMFESSLDGAI